MVVSYSSHLSLYDACYRYIGLPSSRARYEILRSCVMELTRVGIICPPETIGHFRGSEDFQTPTEKLLYEIAECAKVSLFF